MSAYNQLRLLLGGITMRDVDYEELMQKSIGCLIQTSKTQNESTAVKTCSSLPGWALRAQQSNSCLAASFVQDYLWPKMLEQCYSHHL